MRIIDPATEEEVAVVEAGDPHLAVDWAFADWRRVAPGDRARLPRCISSIVDDHLEVRHRTPSGAVKQSGLGRESGPDAPLAFTEKKNIFLSDT